MIDQQLAQLSNLLIILTIVLYVLALIGFGADLSGVTQRRSDQKLRARTRERAELATVGADAPRSASPGVGAAAAPTATGPEDSAAPAAGTTTSSLGPRGFGYVMASIGAVLHITAMVLRGVATGRVPWGNMYEFSMSSSALIIALFVLISIRRKDLRLLGTLVMLPVLVLMLIAQTAWIIPASELTPSLQNTHWLIIHIGIAIIATALSGLGAIVAALQLLSTRVGRVRAARSADGRELGRFWGPVSALTDRIPSAEQLEALCFRLHSLGFICWTFTLIFGAVWANEAWGRYWNWDPKEVWTFVIWVVYACYLHARATRGFRGNKAAWFALAGFACVIINYTLVNLVINGLHSYSGLG
ncbi:c-type cytochrome biogenesis protein CcsB [Brachybacterium endophyticum]|uniref:C-type cytochrome biogenesis protein CcsB n=1 Tax=Brachybacterium endophyticum TaxID=2182385 RepID=A0A2U2RPD7_9MICO|nr:c-type cytochrome biogenesis protein CcsB [Brachybacterium endophyticum]PWH07748.1 c-type cytochrome biogenesis protein CcsB [Brachybacterium endophyticum]